MSLAQFRAQETAVSSYPTASTTALLLKIQLITASVKPTMTGVLKHSNQWWFGPCKAMDPNVNSPLPLTRVFQTAPRF